MMININSLRPHVSLTLLVLSCGLLQVSSASAQDPTAQILTTTVISHQPQFYHGWPTLTQQKSGRLVLVWSGRRDSHVCPFGTVEWMTSSDEGVTWTWPRTLLDSAIDDRDAGVLETAEGTLLVTTFSSLAYEPSLDKAIKSMSWDEEKLSRWIAEGHRIPAEQRKQQLGTWMLRSTDNGMNWSAKYDCLVSSPHGPIQLSDGRILYAGKQLWEENPRVGAAVSKDDGLTWEWLATLPWRESDDPQAFHELHAVEASNGRIIIQIRNHNAQNKGETLQSESDDGGTTWSTPHSIGVWGMPSHLLKLRDGRLLMSYGYRTKPYGNQARVSSDNGDTWSAPMTISGDGAGHDLGYPSTVELKDGTLCTVWYERLAESHNAVLRQAKWKLIEN